MQAVAGIERVLDEDIGERGELPREGRVVPYFACAPPEILEHEHVPWCERSDRLARSRADGFGAEGDARDESGERSRDRLERLGPGFAQMARGDDAAAPA